MKHYTLIIFFTIFTFTTFSQNSKNDTPDFYTNPANGNGSDYGLIGRLKLTNPIPSYTCKEEGKVIVSIKVDRSGKVISAIPGVKGSTTTDTCLLNLAKFAALNTKWTAATNAPEKQIGKVFYNFILR